MNYAMMERKCHGTQEMNFAVYDHPFPGPEAVFDAHWHPEFEIEYVYDGTVEFLLDGVRHCVQSGDMLFVNQNVIHTCEVPEHRSGRYVSIVFGEQFVFSTYGDVLYNKYLTSVKETGRRFPVRLVPGTPGRSVILSHVRALLACYFEKRFAFEIGIRSHFLAIYYTTLEQGIFVREKRTENPAVNLVRGVMLLVQQNYTQTLRLQQLAKNLGVTPQHLGRIFKAAVGKTPMEYILSCRMEHARALLLQSDASIADVAMACGFSDFNYFSRIFKKINGISPRVYRAMYQGAETEEKPPAGG